MPTMKLDEDTIVKLTTDNLRGVQILDEARPGFGLTIYPPSKKWPKGRKTFWIRYSTERGDRRMKKIGDFGIITFDKAWKIAKRQLGIVAAGGDPARDRDEARAIPRFGDWVTGYVERIKRRKRRPDVDEMYLKRAKERWSGKRIDDLTVGDVEAAMVDEAEKARARLEARAAKRAAKEKIKPHAIPETAGHSTANRWLAAVRACLSAAVREGRIKSNPAKMVKPYDEAEPRRRVLTDEEMRRLLDAIGEEKSAFLRCAFRLLIETGARRSEVLRARWSDFDLDGKVWTIPSPKSGHKQVVPLTDSVVAMLRDAPRMKSSPWLVPGPKPGQHRADLRKPWERLCKKAQLEDVTVHDLRRSFGLRVARKAGLHVASRLLRHSSVQVTERVYTPLGFDELRDALDKANEGGKVVRFRKQERANVP